MNARTYKLIFILLCGCVLSILAVQGYWIRNFYLEKTEAFNRMVYSASEKIADKLYERKKLQELKMTYIIVDGDTIAKTPSHRMSIQSASDIKIVNRHAGRVQTRAVTSLRRKSKESKTDSVVISG